jgi:hypothetical protein
LRNEKGGVVRRPFSTLQAWLIAVSPQPGVVVAIGSRLRRLEGSVTAKQWRRSGVAAKPPLFRPRQAPPERNCSFTPL